MEKETKIELVLDVAGWFKERDRIMHEIEVGVIKMFLEHKRHTDQHRSTGCFTVELSLPEVPEQ